MRCSNCGSYVLVKNGKTSTGKQRYKCSNCSVVRVINDNQVIERLALVEQDLAEVKRLNEQFQLQMEKLSLIIGKDYTSHRQSL